jgi:hypothetical protein
MLQHRGLDFDVQLFAGLFAHAMQGMPAARTRLLIVRQVVFDARTRQVDRQRLAAALAARRFATRWQTRLGQGERSVGFLAADAGGGLSSGDLLGFVEKAIGLLLALGGEAFQLRQVELLFKERVQMRCAASAARAWRSRM